MTETVEVRSTGSSTGSSTMVIEGRSADPGPLKPRKTFSDEVYSTFSSPLAWVLVLALLVTWTCVFVILFDLTDRSTLSGRPGAGVRKILKDSGRKGAVEGVTSDPLRLVRGAADDSVNVVSMLLRFAAGLIAPDEDEGNLYAVRKKVA